MLASEKGFQRLMDGISLLDRLPSSNQSTLDYRKLETKLAITP